MTDASKPRIGGILLAAGGSSRLGRPKQLLVFEGLTLIRRAAETLVNSQCDRVVAVLGAEVDVSLTELIGLPLDVYVNEDWQTGMSSSIKSGLKHLLTVEPDLAAVVITVCDQPRIASYNIDELISNFRATGAVIAAAKYNDVIGVPALFSREMFDRIRSLAGDKGARNVIRDCDNVAGVQIPKAALDIDTLEDILALTGAG